MFNIQPIKLLRGSHKNTGRTGQGCFMNVIAYLNNEPVITAKSTCVCVTVRPVAIWLNDNMSDEERPKLLPFLLRAIGSTTYSRELLIERARMCAAYADKLEQRFYTYVMKMRREYYEYSGLLGLIEIKNLKDESVRQAIRTTDTGWIYNSAGLASSTSTEVAQKIMKTLRVLEGMPGVKRQRAYVIEDTLKLLDDLLPPLIEPQQIHVARIAQLAELQKEAQ